MPPAERHWLVAMAGERVVGFGGMMLVGDEAHLMNIATDPAQRRRGLARQLLMQLIADVVERGARHLTLEVRTDNVAALRLYDRFGLVSAGERKDYYGPGQHAAILWVHDIDDPGYLMSVSDDRKETP
ncbi:MAG: ribosomal protein S18-alanine N-acetyltransferase [Acidimicrobiales bacterium]